MHGDKSAGTTKLQEERRAPYPFALLWEISVSKCEFLSAGVREIFSHSVRYRVSRQRLVLREKHGPEKTGLET